MDLQKMDEEAREVLFKWSKLEGHDRCWWYPEYIAPLAQIYQLSLEGITLTPGSRVLFEEGCARFRREQYHNTDTRTSDRQNVQARQAFSNWIDENRNKEYAYHDEILQILANILGLGAPGKPNCC